ncbi:MAG TPA: oligopeptide/dipeptide ABC transporter ATP-binding protein [Dissulfurispiraceae bacterium]|nr:oligopeptide/dipeptide ABC transporter ATP-binding protein [Dissulfurispiraceae bacterium]
MNNPSNMPEHRNEDPLLSVSDIRKYYQVKTNFGASNKWHRAVDGVSFNIRKGNVFAVVGESGCGKSTVARLILRLLEPTSGDIYFKGRAISSLKGEDLRRFRRSVQIIFQDPFASLNPRMRIIDALSEPYKIHKLASRSELSGRVVELLSKVGLNEDALAKYPHEFSGGQRQRICIARTLAVSPELIVADEPLSALDVSIQAQILNLLQSIRQDSGISMIFISHDLRVVRYISDEIAVMYLGKIVELGKTEDIFSAPKHPYTELLLSSAPKLKYRIKYDIGMFKKISDSGDIPNAADIPPGCPFHPRCSKMIGPCETLCPELKTIGESSVACHLIDVA